MKIALIGYGKMGRAIEQEAQARGHEVVLRVSSQNRDSFTAANLQHADVAIEFSRPDAAAANVGLCLDAGIPTICGTTGWNEGLRAIQDRIAAQGGSFLHASNFSVGVNLFFEINRRLAQLMNGHKEYEVRVEEIHHTQKKDAPSGTAISIAEQILEGMEHKRQWILGESLDKQDLAITAHRIDDVPGTHKVVYHSAIDDIEIIHTAHNRKGFALGAVLAAEYAARHSGWHTMKEVLGIG